jgi:FK506-binding protein 8
MAAAESEESAKLNVVGDENIASDKESDTEGSVVNVNNNIQPEEKEEGDDGWLDILGNGQIKKKVLKKGEGADSKPVPSSTVVLRTRGSLDDGHTVDVNDSLKFLLGEGEVLHALDIAVSLMEVGEVAEVKAAPRFLYGELGRPPDIPPNAFVTYELELVSIVQPIESCDLEETQLLEIVERKRAWGNWCFERKEYEQAINCFQKAGTLMEEYVIEKESSKVIRQWMVTCWNNLAASLLKLDLLKEAEDAVKKVLTIEATNPKAVYRMSKLLSSRGEYRKAMNILKKAAEVNPKEKALTSELERVEKLHLQSSQKEKAMYKRMIDGLGKAEKPSKTKPQPTSRSVGVSREEWVYS